MQTTEWCSSLIFRYRQNNQYIYTGQCNGLIFFCGHMVIPFKLTQYHACWFPCITRPSADMTDRGLDYFYIYIYVCVCAYIFNIYIQYIYILYTDASVNKCENAKAKIIDHLCFTEHKKCCLNHPEGMNKWWNTQYIKQSNWMAYKHQVLYIFYIVT